MKTLRRKPNRSQLKAYAALRLIRTQAFNWSLSVGEKKTEERWRALHAKQTSFPSATFQDNPDVYLEWAQRGAQINGMIDAALYRGWIDLD